MGILPFSETQATFSGGIIEYWLERIQLARTRVTTENTAGRERIYSEGATQKTCQICLCAAFGQLHKVRGDAVLLAQSTPPDLIFLKNGNPSTLLIWVLFVLACSHAF